MNSPTRTLLILSVAGVIVPSALHAAPAAPTAGRLVSFCRAHPTVDFPPTESFGPPRALLAIGADKWRCLDGQVLVCGDSADGDQCGRKVDDRQPRIVAQACRETPDSDYVPFYAAHPYRYDWACHGGRAVITRSYPLDRRGFFQKAWARLVVRNGAVVSPREAPALVR